MNSLFGLYRVYVDHIAAGMYSVVPLKRGEMSSIYPQKKPHTSPVRASYEVSFMG